MEINFGSNRLGGVSMDCDMSGVEAMKSMDQEATSSKVKVKTSTLDALKQSEPVTDVPDAALFRDDALGKLVSAAFNLAPPPMPDFASH